MPDECDCAVLSLVRSLSRNDSEISDLLRFRDHADEHMGTAGGGPTTLNKHMYIEPSINVCALLDCRHKICTCSRRDLSTVNASVVAVHTTR